MPPILLRLLAVLLLAFVLRAAVRTLCRPPPSRARPRPVRIDPAVDPAWKLTLLPGIGPVRARALVRARAGPAGR